MYNVNIHLHSTSFYQVCFSIKFLNTCAGIIRILSSSCLHFLTMCSTSGHDKVSRLDRLDCVQCVSGMLNRNTAHLHVKQVASDRKQQAIMVGCLPSIVHSALKMQNTKLHYKLSFSWLAFSQNGQKSSQSSS